MDMDAEQDQVLYAAIQQRRRQAAQIVHSHGHLYAPQASEILRGLYISDMPTATDAVFLSQMRITHRMTVHQDAPFPTCHNFGIKCKHIPLLDKPTARLWMYIDSAVDWIVSAFLTSSENRVLVHCRRGKSRSVAIVVALLVKAYGLSTDDALRYVQDKRPIARPNAGFMHQLRLYEAGMKKKT